MTTLTTVWLLADVILRSSSHPGINSVSFCGQRAVIDHQGHLVNGVNGSIHAVPPQQDSRVTLNQGGRLGLDIERQAQRCAHMEESVTRTPLPLL